MKIVFNILFSGFEFGLDNFLQWRAYLSMHKNVIIQKIRKEKIFGHCTKRNFFFELGSDHFF